MEMLNIYSLTSERRVSRTLTTRLFLVPFHARRNLHNRLLAPNMHRAFQDEFFEAASFDAERLVLITLVHEPAATSGAEIAIHLASGKRLAAVDANITLMRGIEGEGWEDGCDTERGR